MKRDSKEALAQLLSVACLIKDETGVDIYIPEISLSDDVVDITSVVEEII